MIVAPRLRALLKGIRYTPLHPQWFAYLHERKRYRLVGELATGRVLDVGCGRQSLRPHLGHNCDYVSLDGITTGEGLYRAKPDVFGDAQRLPFKEKQFDTVVMLELLEHLEHPDKALRDAVRLLKAGGKLIVSTPFLYPTHDAPWDFQRWTQYGLQRLAGSAGATISRQIPLGRPIESGCQLFNLSLTWQALTCPRVFSPLLILLAVIMIPLANLLAAALSLIPGSPDDSHFTGGYFMILEANASHPA